jgi:carbon-monoxide dehydrogenase medium subunit
MWSEYLRPATIDEALHALAAHRGQARIVAGGTDLVLQLQRGEQSARCLVDVSGLGELRGIALNGDMVTIGAATTHAELAASPLLRRHAAVLAQAAGEVGSAQIRNVATIGGNVVNAQPAADTALALLALDAEAQVVRLDGSAWMPLADLYEGPDRSRVDSRRELLAAFRFRAVSQSAGLRSGSAYRRLGKCKSIALPVLCAAAVVQLTEGRFASAAIALGPVAPRPYRAAEAEAWLAGRPVIAETIAQAAALARAASHPRDSLLRCSAEYRATMVAALVRSVLERAVTAAQE